MRALLSHPWPGNVRELENALEFAATVAQGQTVQPEDLPPEIASTSAGDKDGGAPSRAAGAHERPSRPLSLRRTTPEDREVIRRALETCGWNRLKAAAALGVSRSTLWRRMRELGLE